jgi:hypothetical protein
MARMAKTITGTDKEAERGVERLFRTNRWTSSRPKCPEESLVRRMYSRSFRLIPRRQVTISTLRHTGHVNSVYLLGNVKQDSNACQGDEER